MSYFIISFCWVNIIVTVCLMLIVYRHFQEKSSRAVEDRKKLLFYFLLFPLILFIYWVPSTLNRIAEMISGKEVFALFLITAIAISLLGLLNSICYLWAVFKKQNNIFKYLVKPLKVRQNGSFLPRCNSQDEA